MWGDCKHQNKYSILAGIIMRKKTQSAKKTQGASPISTYDTRLTNFFTIRAKVGVKIRTVLCEQHYKMGHSLQLVWLCHSDQVSSRLLASQLYLDENQEIVFL